MKKGELKDFSYLPPCNKRMKNEEVKIRDVANIISVQILYGCEVPLFE
jgi:hypothetical protein